MRAASAHIASGPGLFPWLSRIPLLPAAVGTCIVVVVVTALILAVGTAGRPPLRMATRVLLRRWPGPGFARGRLELRRSYGLPSARRVARRGRPSLTWRSRRFGPWQAYSGYLGRAHGWLLPPRVHTHNEQLRLVIAPPQKGKSAAAVGSIIDDPGPVVATSIRGDLIGASAGLRQQVGTAHVFNPEGAGDYGSTLTWNPVAGCQGMETAARRAGYMVEGVTARGLDEASFWQDQASMVLAAYLHAAGLAGGSMRDVYRWILDDDPQALTILDRHPGAAEFAAGAVRKYLSLPDRTKAGISTTLNGALRFMQDPRVVETLCPPGAGTLDIEAFLRTRDTLYLVVADAAQSPVPPVFTTLVAEIAHIARHISGTSGRLDPPLTLELDEIGNTAPVPVAAWATWAAGSGIAIKIYAQSFAQLAQRWGDHGAATIWQSCDVKVIYAHTTEDDLAHSVEQACGRVRVRAIGSHTPAAQAGQAGTRTYTWAEEPVLPANVLRELPAGRAVVIQGGARPVIVRTERYWQRRDVRRFTRRGGRPALPAAAAPRIPIPDPALLDLAAQPQPAMLGTLEQMLAAMPQAADGWAGDDADWAAEDAWPGDDGWPGDELAARRRARGLGTRPPAGAVRQPWPELAPPAWGQDQPGWFPGGYQDDQE